MKVRCTDFALSHLKETPLNWDQKITESENGEMTVTAKVFDSSGLNWWLLGFGDQVEVLGPKKLRNEMASMAKNLNKIYS